MVLIRSLLGIIPDHREPWLWPAAQSRVWRKRSLSLRWFWHSWRLGDKWLLKIKRSDGNWWSGELIKMWRLYKNYLNLQKNDAQYFSMSLGKEQKPHLPRCCLADSFRASLMNVAAIVKNEISSSKSPPAHIHKSFAVTFNCTSEYRSWSSLKNKWTVNTI